MGVLVSITTIPSAADVGVALALGEPSAALRSFVLLVILDEATANLDAATESEVFANVRDFARGKTMLVISHRPPALELADRVITLTAPADLAGAHVGR